MKKMYLIELDVTSTHWETAEALVEAESKEEARKLFEANPWSYEWDHWDQQDSETTGWEISHIEYDEWSTERMNAKQSNT